MPKVQGSGRKMASEWLEVTKIDGDSKCKCKHCDLSLSCKIERIKAHLKKCPAKRTLSKNEESFSENKHPMLTTSEEIETSFFCTSGSSSATPIPSTSSSPSSAEIMQRSITDYVVKTTEEQKRSIDKAVSMFFYAANIPFNVAELDNFKHMIQILRPGYKPPSAKDISGRLLDAAVQQVDVELEQKVRNCSLTLTLDGWSSVKNDPIQAITIHTGIESFLLQAYDAGSQKKDSKQCASLIEAAINECCEKLHSKVFAIVTDNENKMGKMWDILKKKYPDLITYGCSAHLLNLVERDVTPKTIMCHIVEINKYFRNVHQAHGWLVEQGGHMPQLPNDTRWNSHLDSVRSFMLNYHKYREIALEHSQDFSTNIANLLNNVALYKDVVHLDKQLSVVADALDKLQKETTCISEAVEIWLNLLSSDVLMCYYNYFWKRFQQAIQPPHILANLTDPKFQGQHLSEEQENSAETWLANHHPEYLPGVLAFKIKDPDYYPASMMHESVIEKFTSQKWWQIMAKKCEKNSKFPPGFGEFFFSLHSAPASSASIERFFSTFGLVWSKLRNRLGIDRATKLVKVYRHIRSKLNYALPSPSEVPTD